MHDERRIYVKNGKNGHVELLMGPFSSNFSHEWQKGEAICDDILYYEKDGEYLVDFD